MTDIASTTAEKPAKHEDRLFFSVMVICVALVVAVALFLKPDPSGMGTHRQLGLPECGFVKVFDKPCLTCGYTTTFSLGAHLRWKDAAQNQPAGFLLFLGMVWLLLGSVVGLFTGYPVRKIFPPKWTTRYFIFMLCFAPTIWVLYLVGVL